MGGSLSSWLPCSCLEWPIEGLDSFKVYEWRKRVCLHKSQLLGTPASYLRSYKPFGVGHKMPISSIGRLEPMSTIATTYRLYRLKKNVEASSVVHKL